MTLVIHRYIEDTKKLLMWSSSNFISSFEYCGLLTFFRTYEPESVYHSPEYFSSDWMNEFWAFRCDLRDDFRFVYIGPRGTWTPLHADVYCSYSWSANVCGRKRWILFKPGLFGVRKRSYLSCTPYIMCNSWLSNLEWFSI